MPAPLKRLGGSLVPALIAACAGLAGGCAVPRVPHIAPDESRPHITWEVRSGGDTGDGDLICGSTSASRPCVLSASGAEPELVVVRVYLHAAAQPTSYIGVVTAPFVAAASADGREINITVPADSRPVALTLLGRVTPSAGAYTLSVRLDAVAGTGGAPVRIAEEIPVTVKAPAGAATVP